MSVNLAVVALFAINIWMRVLELVTTLPSLGSTFASNSLTVPRSGKSACHGSAQFASRAIVGGFSKRARQ
jgi:hypothetical protein